MRVRQLIKVLNNTELGKGRTHECYVLVSKKVEIIGDLFDEIHRNPEFINLVNSEKINSIHITEDREFRINGLGDFYRDNNVEAGDEIIFKRCDNNGNVRFYVNIKKKLNSIFFQRNSKGFEILNFERMEQVMVNNTYETIASYNNSSGQLKIKFKEAAKKRQDSPEVTNFYSILFNERDILEDFKRNEYLELELSNERKLKKVVTWQSYEFNY